MNDSYENSKYSKIGILKYFMNNATFYGFSLVVFKSKVNLLILKRHRTSILNEASH